MSSEPIEGFANNWAYLRTELNWLERLLMVAIARQRKDTKEVERVARTRADKATSHWWKGVVTGDGVVAYDDYRKAPASPTQSYQQQLDGQIQASQHRGIVLALPALCDRLQLSLFEKHLILMSLAPEVNRRYANLYRYLQGDALGFKTDLPTVDLALRLFCRNDLEWRTARHRLGHPAPLWSHGLVTMIQNPVDTVLNAPIKLSEEMLRYLMAESPTADHLNALLNPPAPLGGVSQRLQLASLSATTAWSALNLPEPLVQTLKLLVQSVQCPSTDPAQEEAIAPPGQIVVLAGGNDATRTTAADAIAHGLNERLIGIDLSLIDDLDADLYWAELEAVAPAVLLITAAEHWLRRSAQVSEPGLNRFWHARRRAGLTLLSVNHKESIALRWLRQVDQVLEFPSPKRSGAKRSRS